MKAKFIVLFVLTISRAWANDKYFETMQKNIQQVYSANTSEEILVAVNSFERIGNAEKDKWEPYYYASFGYIMASLREQEGNKKDAMLDKASDVLKKAAALNSDESEIVALEGFIYMIRVTVDPASRGQEYSGLAMQTFGRALGLNPGNPRAMALLAQMEYGTAQFFKASTANACATATKSIEMFDGFKSDNPLAPRWGKETSLQLLERCNK